MGGRIKVKTSREQDKVLLEVQDTGIGIADDQLDRITDPFWTTKESHTGMGLAVNCRILPRTPRSNGSEKAQGQRTIFTVKLP